MDTWATSSLTSQIACGWERDPDLFDRTFPMDLHAQAHDIIRTWLFSSVLRAHLENGSLPWRRAALSGFVVDPDRKKMGKSTGNATTPVGIIERYGADAVRWRAACARPGRDTPFDKTQMKVGRRLATKLLNVSRFILRLDAIDGSAIPNMSDGVTEPLDRAMLVTLADVVRTATQAMDAYDYTTALETVERFFWAFCDDYVELVKERAYGSSPTSSDGALAADASRVRSARAALELALLVQLRLFAPVMPFVTAEIWSWWRTGSVHRAPWPVPGELSTAGKADIFSDARTVLAGVRRLKHERQLSMRAALLHVVISAPEATLHRVRTAVDDLVAAGRIGRITFMAALDVQEKGEGIIVEFQGEIPAGSTDAPDPL